MRVPRALLLAAMLLCGADAVQAQAPSARADAHPPLMVAPGDRPLAPAANAGAEPGPSMDVPASRTRLDGNHFSAAALASQRRIPARGLAIGAVVGGAAAGAFTWSLREDTGSSAFGEMAAPVLAGAAVGGLVGGLVELLFDR